MYRFYKIAFCYLIFIFCSSSYAIQFVDSNERPVNGNKLCAMISSDGTRQILLGYHFDDENIMILNEQGEKEKTAHCYWLDFKPGELTKLYEEYKDNKRKQNSFTEIDIFDKREKESSTYELQGLLDNLEEKDPLYSIEIRNPTQDCFLVTVKLKASKTACEFSIFLTEDSLDLKSKSTINCCITPQYIQLLKEYKNKQPDYSTDRANYYLLGYGWVMQIPSYKLYEPIHIPRKEKPAGPNGFRNYAVKAFEASEKFPNHGFVSVNEKTGKYSTGPMVERKTNPISKNEAWANNKVWLRRMKE